MAGWRLHRGGDCQQNAQKEAKGWEGYGTKDGFPWRLHEKEMCGMAQKKQTNIQTHTEMGGINKLCLGKGFHVKSGSRVKP
jgi:hypothetical protein